MDKLFTEVYKKIIMQEDYNPEGINIDAIAAVTKGWTNRWPGSPHPLDQNWLIPNSVDLNQVGIDDWDKYTKIVDDIRYDKYTLKDIFNNIQYFLKNKRGIKTLQKYITSLDIPITDEHSLINVVLSCMLEQGQKVFKTTKDWDYTKVYYYMDMTIEADMNMSIIYQTTLNIDQELKKLGIFDLIK